MKTKYVWNSTFYSIWTIIIWIGNVFYTNEAIIQKPQLRNINLGL